MHALQMALQIFVYTTGNIHSPVAFFGTAVQMLGNAVIQLANHIAATACRHSQDSLLKFKPSVRMRKKWDLCDFDHGMVVCTRQAGLGISLLIYQDFPRHPSLVFSDNGPKKRKYPVRSSSLSERVVLMLEIRGEWAEGLGQGRQQQQL